MWAEFSARCITRRSPAQVFPHSRMKSSILVFTRDQQLLLDLGQQFAGQHPIVPCETLDALPQRIGAQPTSAVLVHLERNTLNGYSPGRFIAELDEAIE